MQPLLSPDALHTLVIDLVALTLHQRGDVPVAVLREAIGNFRTASTVSGSSACPCGW
ncbi:hypothetical protein HC928_09330 [bacterium]|nr:hypothetical protein [bacterium]